MLTCAAHKASKLRSSFGVMHEVFASINPVVGSDTNLMYHSKRLLAMDPARTKRSKNQMEQYRKIYVFYVSPRSVYMQYI
ncbi:hypothetical protein KFK09_016807 [Dendrobium nobile]|uniref:Uncharacterized protein n=1 Tax=Dendrobium nobile TaxID=94219 RepID=A0A8T3B1N2_DENNO|nr:hypothetical protein KFK09_016807 [Dendrobium nobile]